MALSFPSAALIPLVCPGLLESLWVIGPPQPNSQNFLEMARLRPVDAFQYRVVAGAMRVRRRLGNFGRPMPNRRHGSIVLGLPYTPFSW